MTSEARTPVKPERDFGAEEIEGLNDDVMHDVLREKKRNPPQFKSVWEEDQADEGTGECHGQADHVKK
jgi:hypothetical protein